MAILKRGLAGEPVRMLQKKLGIEADGDFGPGTETALKDYQKANGLAVDGVAGPDTFMKMGLHELVLLKTGTSGEAVRRLQTALGIPADGKFGAATEKAVRDYQAKNALTADGMAGPRTLAHMKIFREVTEDVVAKSFVPASSAEAVGGSAASGSAGLRSIWDTIKSIVK
jgi:peptidoglycan hydrolase-like protein with peptidoglycan-binding domain